MSDGTMESKTAGAVGTTQVTSTLPAHDGSVYEQIGAGIGHTVTAKQAAYGDAFGRSGGILKILYPNGVKPEQYTDFLSVVRVIDKLFRIATNRDAFGETPWRDIAGYAILATEITESERVAVVGSGRHAR